MTKLSSAVLTLTFALASNASFANICDKDALPERPAIPNGESANFDEMAKARNAVALYVEANSTYVNCLPSSYLRDIKVNRIHRVADRFNEQLVSYKSRFTKDNG